MLFNPLHQISKYHEVKIRSNIGQLVSKCTIFTFFKFFEKTLTRVIFEFNKR